MEGDLREQIALVLLEEKTLDIIIVFKGGSSRVETPREKENIENCRGDGH